MAKEKAQDWQSHPKFPDEYYQNGFEAHPRLKFQGLIITDRWKDIVIGDISVGSTIEQVKTLLGDPGLYTQPNDYLTEWFLYYKTTDYYIAFNGRQGSQQVERIMFRKAPPNLEQPDIMYEIIENALESNMFETWGTHDFFDNETMWQGQKYRSSEHGIEANDNYGDPQIVVYNNFSGNLYNVAPEEACPFRIEYHDEDNHIANMRAIFETSNKYHDLETYGNNISPDGRYAYKAEWMNSETRYYIIYDTWGLRHPMCVYAFNLEDGWLDNNKLWYTDDLTGNPYIIEITDPGYEIYPLPPNMKMPEGYVGKK